MLKEIKVVIKDKLICEVQHTIYTFPTIQNTSTPSQLLKQLRGLVRYLGPISEI